jgi:hypothetical protein
MKYEWLHLWKTWEIKLKTIFGDKNDDPEVITDENSEYTWEPGESLERFEDPDFQENIKKLL